MAGPRGASKPTRGRGNVSRRGRGVRIQKPTTRSVRKSFPHAERALARDYTDAVECVPSYSEARDLEATAEPALPGLVTTSLRTPISSIHRITEHSLGFITPSHLRTDADTNTLTLNLMEYFLFSADNWLPELSYSMLHAACFAFASFVTGKDNTFEDIADSLGPEKRFVRLMAEPLAGDGEAAKEIAEMLAVSEEDVERGFLLLWDRKEALGSVMGKYAERLTEMVYPTVVEEKEPKAEIEDDLDIFEEPA